MFIVAAHTIFKPKEFWDVAQKLKLPDEVKLHSTYPNSDGTKAVCLWEGKDLVVIRNIVEEHVGKFSKNEYYAVEPKNAIGLPH